MEDSVTLLARDVLTRGDVDEIEDELERFLVKGDANATIGPLDAMFLAGFIAAVEFLGTEKTDRKYGWELERFYRVNRGMAIVATAITAVAK